MKGSVRRLPPVYSPLSLGALSDGWAAALSLRDAAVDATRLAGELRKRFHAERVVLTDSGTTALALAMRAAHDAHPGPAVALPAYCCYDLATAAAMAQVPVRLYDLDPTTLGPAWPSFERALTAGVRTVVVAHLFGLPVDMERARALCDQSGALLIEDAAQGAGGELHGQGLGTFAPLSVLSFGRGKGITGGSGGALLGRGEGAGLAEGSEQTLERGSRGMGALLGATVQWLLGRPTWYAVPSALPFLRLGQTVYRPPHLPRGLAPACASVALHSLNRSRAEAEARRTHAGRLKDVALRAGVPTPQPVPGADPGYLRFPLLLDAATDGAAALGITRAYPLTLAQLPELRPRCVNAHDRFPGAEELASRLHTAPTHSLLSARDVERLQSWIESYAS